LNGKKMKMNKSPSWASLVEKTVLPINRSRGLFIVLEGCDRVGKTTQAAAIAAGLSKHGISVHQMSFPNRSTPLGKVIDEHLRGNLTASDEAISLLFSANRWECCDTIVKTLLEGTTIICDRYSHSGVAYSVAKGLDQAWCESADAGLPEPDIILYLDAPPSTLQTRPGYGGERFERTEFQQQVHTIYESMKARNFQGMIGDSSPAQWSLINANLSPEEVTKDALFIIRLAVFKEGKERNQIRALHHTSSVPLIRKQLLH
jgi:dTMP kinase